MSGTLPHRFSERSFRRYESVIAAIVIDFPRVTVVRPSDFKLSAETVRGRLRDAITSLKCHNWPTTINITQFLMIYEQIVVSLRPDGMVAVGNKDTVKDTIVEPIVAIDPTSVLDCTQVELSISTMCWLAHSRALSKRLKFALTSESATSLMEQYDIVLTQQPDGLFLLS